jgi:hypothetical protein
MCQIHPTLYFTKSSFKFIIINGCSKKGCDYIIDCRYSQFDKLQEDLKVLLGSNVPQLPKKTFISFFRSKTTEEIDERRIGLEGYLNELISRVEVFNSEPLRQFLEIDSNAHDRLLNPP